jgi:hypothetical protein
MTVDWVKLELDLASFDPAPYEEFLEATLRSGITISTLAELGNIAKNQHRLYELNAECSGDIPGRGPFYSWPEYRRQRIDVESFDPRCVLIARRDGEWVGMASISAHPAKGFLFTEMTGVVRSERRRGLALTLKVRNMEFGAVHGLTDLRTVHHPDNVGIIALNRRLGYVDATWPYPPA